MRKLNLGKAIQFLSEIKEKQLPIIASAVRKVLSLLREQSRKKKTDHSAMKDEELASLPHSQKLRFNLKTLLVLPIISVIIASSLFIAYESYEKNRQVTINAVENQMQLSTEVMKEKISMLKATVTNQEFPKKLAYELQLTQTHFKKSNLNAMQFKITQDKKPAVFEGVDSTLPNLPGPIIDQMFQQKDGIIHDQGLTLAFSFQLEMDGSLYVIALHDQEYLQTVVDYRNYMMEMTLITILLASLVGFFTIRKVTKPIALLNDAMEEVSNGNLHTRIYLVSASKEMESLSFRFNQMVENLTELIGHLDSSSKHVISASEQLRLTSRESKLASEQIATAMSEVAIGTEKQVEFAIEASDIVSEITKGMEQAAISIEHVETSSVTAKEKTIIGNQLVMKTVEQMKLVQQTVGETADKVNVLGEKTKQVDKILGLIGEIAAQTNLLSLNAAIEAARAGEHGRGFAVVADEVRKLADQSGQAAKQIRSLIDEIRGGTDQVVQSMGRGAGVLKEGIDVVQKTDQAFQEIALAVGKVSDETQEVSAIVNEVSAQTQNMVSSMEQISLIAKQFAGNTQHVAAAAEEQSASMDEISNASEDLHRLSRDLDRIMGNFKVKE